MSYCPVSTVVQRSLFRISVFSLIRFGQINLFSYNIRYLKGFCMIQYAGTPHETPAHTMLPLTHTQHFLKCTFRLDAGTASGDHNTKS